MKLSKKESNSSLNDNAKLSDQCLNIRYVVFINIKQTS